MKSLITLTLIALSASVQAVEFDRPGLAFSPSTLEPGQIALEQGLPSFSYAHQGADKQTQLSADTLVRIGFMQGFEVQLGATPWGWQKTETGATKSTDSGLGDGSLSIKWAPALEGDIAFGLLASTSLAFGEAPIGDQGDNSQLGATLSFALPKDMGLSLYLNHSDGDAGSGWLFSPSLSFPLNTELAGYVEAGLGEDSLYSRSLGTGLTYALSPNIQLDAWLLAGLDSQTTDLEGGFGIAWLIP